MSLKELIAKDIAIFFNTDEFAEMHNIDDREVVAIVDSDLTKIRSNRTSQQYEGVYAGELIVFAKAADFPIRPVFGQGLHLDGKLYTVVACSESGGVLEITLGANES